MESVLVHRSWDAKRVEGSEDAIIHSASAPGALLRSTPVASQPVPAVRALAVEADLVSGFDRIAAPMRDTEATIGFYRALELDGREVPGICSLHFGGHKRNFRRPSV